MPDTRISDDELTALALAADIDTPVDPDAVPLADFMGTDTPALLPAWYMPAPVGGRPARPLWLRWVVAIIVASFLALNAYGLCSTYGDVGFH
ncbi:MAG: hypothetical protein ACRD12_06690 [Acidimicrobiales bacterium]